MKQKALFSLIVTLCAMLFGSGAAWAQPQADVVTDADPYRWMEQNDTPRVQQWLDGQSAKSTAYFQGLSSRDALRDRFRSLFSHDTVAMPYPYQHRYFTQRRLAAQDMSVLYVQDGLNGEPSVVLDPNGFSPDHSVTLSSWAPSGDGSLLVYGRSSAGNDKVSLHLYDVANKRELPDTVPDDFYPSFSSWDSGSKGFWYSKHDPEKPMDEAKLYQQLYYHVIGTTWQEDTLVFGASDGLEKEALISGGTVGGGRYLSVSVYGQDKLSGKSWNEAYLRERSDTAAKFVRVVSRDPGSYTGITVHGDALFLITDKDAPRTRILRTSVAAAMAGTAKPKVFLAEGKGTVQDTTFIGDKLFVTTLENVHSVLRQYDLKGRFVRNIALPTLGSLSGPSYTNGGKELFYSFTSFVVPTTVLRLDIVTSKVSVLAKAAAGFDVDKMETRQVWYPSKDGTRIPMFLISKKGLPRDGNNPTVLYGYGGFNISLTPEYDKRVVPFLEHGGVYAIANLRGGGEFGEEWHKAGTKERKQNVFDDFAAAAEWLVKNKYTRKERLAIQGGSNGGLLVTATITQHPELVQAAVAMVPVTDMLRYHKFFGGLYWIPDYGDPEDPVMRSVLLAYSPYHNVRDGEKYPATLIVTSDGDDRVHPMHSYKMTARLQEANASGAPILLRVERQAGHGGASAISKVSDQLADEWGFLFEQLGITY